MRLKQIKLAGFKSFVDATVVPFPTAMTCVVGPNGCGKSNVIDAVRWVLGESSAKNLRGDAMTDVIFNGSAQRKPVSQASVELVFENTQGRLQGSMADRSEIAVKRVVTRDAQSLYFLNGTKCRRRDITDIFLGTGLGPRSYAIIEQGMISRLIESRPQELRVFIEEAAGISRYKERRKETENRISHTRDNLERLNDVRDELGKNIDKLKRQAASAERYKELRASERKLKAELTTIRFLHFNQQYQQTQQQLSELETQYAAIQSQDSGTALQLTQAKMTQQSCQSELQTLQSAFFQISNRIQVLEQQQLHQRSRAEELRLELQQLEKEILQATDDEAREQTQLADFAEEWQDLSPKLQLLEEQRTELQGQVEQAEHNYQAAVAQTQAMQQQGYLQIQTLREAQLTLSHNQSSQQKLQNQQAALTEKLAHAPTIDAVALANLRAQMDNKAQQISAAEAELAAMQAKVLTENDAQQQSALRLAELKILQQAKQAELTRLETRLSELKQAQPLLGILDIEPGWDVAIALALQGLQWATWEQSAAFGHTNANPHLAEGATWPSLISAWQGRAPEHSLASKIKANAQGERLIPAYFAHILVCDELTQAQQLAPTLTDSQSVICKQGIWLGNNWQLAAKTEQQDNLHALSTQGDQLKQQLTTLQLEQHQLQQSQSLREQQLVSWQGDSKALYDALQQQQSQWRQMQLQEQQWQLQEQHEAQQQAQARLQLQAIELDLAMLLEQAESLYAEIEHTEEAKAAISDSILLLEQAQQRGQQDVKQLRSTLQTVQQQLAEQQVQQVSLQRQQEAASQHLARSKLHRQKLQQRLAQLTAAQDLLSEPDVAAAEELLQLLDMREENQAMRLGAEQQLDSISQQIRQLELGQHSVLQQLQAQQKTMEHLRIDAQGFQVRANAMLEALQEQQVQLKDVVPELPAETNETHWQQQLEKTSDAISRLGPVNLAAIDEYQQQSARKTYLDNQYQDLTSALDTLETAIKKIDKETRAKFKSTFDFVNEGLQSLFPKVFGGGSAYLDLTGEDLLETGVTIMARPPGKKNSTIHLLSGGEKALTALSLVFSIFRLNPAPFCLLDEVDAPLDDANVGRFCNLVREMSDSVQFIYISHNKIAMEMAAQLMGVTMQEPGVSRVVAVDVEDAVKMAQA